MAFNTVIILILLVLAVLFVGYLVSIYNALIRVKHQVDKAFKNIDVLLKQRTDELTKLIDIVKGHMDYEKSILRELTEARTFAQKAKNINDKIKAENISQKAMSNLFAVAENYPQLKASSSFNHLEQRVSAIEDQIADRREFFNDAIFTFNMRIEQIPYSFFAATLGYRQLDYFKVDEEDKKDVKISFK